jgi:hypothetical protein
LSHAVVCAEGFLPPELAAGFGLPRVVAGYPVVVRGEQYQQLWWIEYSAPPPAPPAEAANGWLDGLFTPVPP